MNVQLTIFEDKRKMNKSICGHVSFSNVSESWILSNKIDYKYQLWKTWIESSAKLCFGMPMGGLLASRNSHLHIWLAHNECTCMLQLLQECVSCSSERNMKINLAGNSDRNMCSSKLICSLCQSMLNIDNGWNGWNIFHCLS